MTPHRDKMLALRAATIALDIDPAEQILHDLALLCVTPDDVLDAVTAMRRADNYDRVTAAFRMMRDRARRREFVETDSTRRTGGLS